MIEFRNYLQAIFWIILFGPARAQTPYKAEKFEPNLVKAPYGALLMFTGKFNSFSIKFESPDVQPTQKQNFILMDHQLIQANLIPFQKDFGFDNLAPEKQKELLNRYKEFEKKHVESGLNIKIKEKEAFAVFNHKLFKTWMYQMPKGKQSVVKQVYFMTICFDQILVLSAPVPKGESDMTVVNLLQNVAETLTLFPGQRLEPEAQPAQEMK